MGEAPLTAELAPTVILRAAINLGTRFGLADIGFLAIEPAREAEVAFTPPYVVIEGVYAVPDRSPITTAAEVDRPGVRVGVKRGSAYDLFLSRTLIAAEVVRGEDGIEVFLDRGLEVAAGIRRPLARAVARTGGLRILEPRFMEIRQAVATPRPRSDAAAAFLHEAVEGLKADGFVAAALERSGQDAPGRPAGLSELPVPAHTWPAACASADGVLQPTMAGAS